MLTPFQARYEISGSSEVSPGVFEIYGGVYDLSPLGWAPTDAAIGDLVFDDDGLGVSNCYRVTQIVAAGPGLNLTVRAVYNEDGAIPGSGQPNACSGIICRATGDVQLGQEPSVTFSGVSEPVINAMRNYDSRKSQFKFGALGSGATGPTGATGATGATGTTGATGMGVTAGGSTGQVLTKNSTTDYDTSWQTPSAGGGTPGGVSGQLQYNSSGVFAGLNGRVSTATTWVEKKVRYVPLLAYSLTKNMAEYRNSVVAGGSPWGIAFDGAYMWVVNYVSTGSVSKIDISTNTIVATIPLGFNVGEYSKHIVFDGSHMWITAVGSTAVKKVNVLTNTVVATVSGLSDFGAAGMAFDGTYVYIPSPGNAYVDRINVTTNVKTSISQHGGYATDSAFDGTHVWITRSNNNDVEKIDINNFDTFAPNERVTVGTYPKCIAFDGTHMWVGNANSKTISKIDISTNTVVATITVPVGPSGIAFDGVNIWVGALSGGNDIYVIDIDSNTVIRTITTSGAPGACAFDGSHMWVALTGSGATQKYLARRN